MKHTICKPSDLKQHETLSENENRICSRCKQKINGEYLKIRPSFETAFRRNKLTYYYHLECINESMMMMKLNYFRFWILYLLERLHYKMIFLEFFGLGYNQLKRKRKQNKLN